MKAALKLWAILTGIKALKTSAQALVALMGADAVNILSLPWGDYLGIAAGAGVACILHNITSFPEPAVADERVNEFLAAPAKPAPAVPVEPVPVAPTPQDVPPTS